MKVVMFIIITVSIIALILSNIIIQEHKKQDFIINNYEKEIFDNRIFAREIIEENNNLREELNKKNAIITSLKNNTECNQRIEELINEYNSEKLSPQSRININDILIDKNFTLINIEGIQAGILRDSNSMDPLLDENNIVLEKIPESTKDIHLGDIIIYEYNDARIIHRVISIGYDNKGWFVITKGDNLLKNDPSKVRFSQIKGVVVGIIY